MPNTKGCLWNLGVGKGWKHFEEHDRKSLNWPEQMLVKIWMLKTPLVRLKEKARRMLDKVYIAFENT